MRLWHQQLIPYLPRQQLLGQHRECCALRGNGWKKKHAIVDYVFQYPPERLYNYHVLIMNEMTHRGYKVDPLWKQDLYRGKSAIPFDPDIFTEKNNNTDEIIYPEHDQLYLQICYDNLKEKGIDLFMYGLDQERQKLINFINTISDEQANIKPDQQTWSILEVLEHLYLMEKGIISKIGNALETGKVQTEIISPKPIERTIDRDFKIDAPETLKPKGNFKTLNQAKDHLVKSREAILFLTHNKDEKTLQAYCFTHPVFGEMNLQQWIEFIGLHELRHLEQMKEIKARIS